MFRGNSLSRVFPDLFVDISCQSLRENRKKNHSKRGFAEFITGVLHKHDMICLYSTDMNENWKASGNLLASGRRNCNPKVFLGIYGQFILFFRTLCHFSV